MPESKHTISQLFLIYWDFMNSIWTECMISLPAPKPIDTHRIANTDGDGNALRVDPTTAKVISMHIGSPQRLMSPTIPPNSEYGKYMENPAFCNGGKKVNMM